MRLDAASMSPAMLDLRMNTRNLVNEMKYNGGKIVSHQFALMKPRPKQGARQKPQELNELRNKVKSLEKKVSRKQTHRKRMTEFGGTSTDGRAISPQNKASSLRPEAKEDPAGEEPLSMDDPRLDIEVSRLLEDGRIEPVWRTLQGASRP
jgi:hypothetical protein